MVLSRFKVKNILSYLLIWVLCFGSSSNALSNDSAIQITSSSTFESIKVIHNPSLAQLEELDVSHWPTWRKEISEFTWYFSGEETAYILEGEVLVWPEGTPESKAVLLKKGDLVTFSAGLISRWVVKKEVYKHYSLKESFWGTSYWWVVFKLNAAKKRFDRFILTLQ
jgi:uncharacterized cupin superfamily protein